MKQVPTSSGENFGNGGAANNAAVLLSLTSSDAITSITSLTSYYKRRDNFYNFFNFLLLLTSHGKMTSFFESGTLYLHRSSSTMS